MFKTTSVPHLPVLRDSFRTERKGGGYEEDGVEHCKHHQDFSETISDISKSFYCQDQLSPSCRLQPSWLSFSLILHLIHPHPHVSRF